jgi:hypothetical protein
MAGPKGGAKGAAAKSAEAKKAKDAAAAALAAAEESDDEEWVLDTTTPVVLDRRPPKTWKPAPLPDLPPVHDGRDAGSVGFDFDDPDSRRARVDEDAAIIARAKAIVDARESVGRKIAAGPYHGGARSRTTHWDYVLVEMRWMARDFAAERDWKLEAARRCGNASAAMRGKPVRYEPPEEESERRRTGAKVAREVARFWAAAWKRALRRPIPTAAELVPEPRGKGTATDTRAGDHPDAGVPGGSGTAAEDATKGGAGAAVKGGESASLEQHPSAANGGDATEAADAGEEAGREGGRAAADAGRGGARGGGKREGEGEVQRGEDAAQGGARGGEARERRGRRRRRDGRRRGRPTRRRRRRLSRRLLRTRPARGFSCPRTRTAATRPIRVSSPPRIHARSRAGSPRRRRRRPG